MVWFSCDSCGDSIKKPKLDAHERQCRGGWYTCIDCSANFDYHSAKGHVSCITEEQKYVQCVTKGTSSGVNAAKIETLSQAEGMQYLSDRPPWMCSICNITCTSRETMLGHASGAKHCRRVRAANKTQAAQQPNGAETKTETTTVPSKDHEPNGVSADCTPRTSTSAAHVEPPSTANGALVTKSKVKRKRGSESDHEQGDRGHSDAENGGTIVKPKKQRGENAKLAKQANGTSSNGAAKREKVAAVGDVRGVARGAVTKLLAKSSKQEVRLARVLGKIGGKLGWGERVCEELQQALACVVVTQTGGKQGGIGGIKVVGVGD